MSDDPYSLEGLSPIVESGPVGWFPFAPGVWFLIALVAVWVLRGVIVWIADYRSNAYRREALRLLVSLETTESMQEGLRRANEVLKRAALVAFPRQQVAPLWGERWIDFLDAKADQTLFKGSVAECLAWSSHESLPDDFVQHDYRATLRSAQAWVRKHRREDD